MMYLSKARDTALAEVGTAGARFHVVEVELRSPLKVLNLSYLGEAETRSEIVFQCLARSALCAAPRLGEGWTKREYVFNRFVADCARHARSEEHTSELQSLMRISSAVFCLKKNKRK